MKRNVSLKRNSDRRYWLRLYISQEGDHWVNPAPQIRFVFRVFANRRRLEDHRVQDASLPPVCFTRFHAKPSSFAVLVVVGCDVVVVVVVVGGVVVVVVVVVL